MINDVLFLYINTTLAVVCGAFAIVFLTLPLPSGEGLRCYRRSLHFLALAYFALSLFVLFTILIGNAIVNLLSVPFLTEAFLQTLFLTFSFIAILHPERVTWKFVLKNLLPVATFNLIYWLVAIKFGNPVLPTMELLIDNWLYPSVFIRIVMFVGLFIQFIFCIYFIHNEIRYYNDVLNTCDAGNYRLQLPWPVACFNSTVVLGLYAIVTSMVTSPAMVLIFYMFCALFYVVFGTCYIQYPRYYLKAEKASRMAMASEEIKLQATGKISWENLKEKIITEKYFVLEGVNIADMAQYLRVGRTTLSGFINKEEGVNFNAWIRLLRINEAILILSRNKNISLAEVSEMVGYSEPSNFSRQFKIVMGVTPTEWCRQNCIDN